MVIVSDPRLIARRMAGRLDAPDEARFLQDVQIVIHGLRGKCAEPLARGVRDGFRIPMLSYAQDRQEYGETGSGHPQAGAGAVTHGGWIRPSVIPDHYRRLIWNESMV